MSETAIGAAEAGAVETGAETGAAEAVDTEQAARELTRKLREKSRESLEAMKAGKGRLKLETPILAGDTQIDELVYDFTTLTGLEYTNAMDSDITAREVYRITNRQALALFAAAAARHTERVDAKDIIERIGMTDAVEGVQLATAFFLASTRAGRFRISKK